MGSGPHRPQINLHPCKANDHETINDHQPGKP